MTTWTFGETFMNIFIAWDRDELGLFLLRWINAPARAATIKNVGTFIVVTIRSRAADASK
jgi:hypothetical protein